MNSKGEFSDTIIAAKQLLKEPPSLSRSIAIKQITSALIRERDSGSRNATLGLGTAAGVLGFIISPVLALGGIALAAKVHDPLTSFFHDTYDQIIKELQDAGRASIRN